MSAAVVLPQSNSKVLEDGEDGVLPELEIKSDEEVVELTEVPAKPVAEAGGKPPAPPKKPEVAAPAAGEDDDLPPELKGKSPKELAKMYKEAQSLIGRQGSELGDLRRRTDTAIQASLAALSQRREAPAPKVEAPAEPEKIDEAEFFRAPGDAIARAIAAHPVIKRIEETLGKSAKDQAVSRAEQAAERFNGAHPDAAEIMANPEFRQWVGASRVRQGLLMQAHRDFNFEAGDEVFGTWKALKGIGKKAPAPAATVDPAAEEAANAAKAAEAGRILSQQAKRKRELAAGSVPSGGGAGGSGAPTGSKKIFRRADVLKLMETDQDRYEQLAPEIEAAYREGRVR